MSKKIITTSVAILLVIAFSIFSLSNVFALEGPDTEPPSGSEGPTSEPMPTTETTSGSASPASPLTSPARLCGEATSSYARDVMAAKAKGLSLSLSSEELLQMIRDIRTRRDALCGEAAGAKGLSSGARLSSEAKGLSGPVKLTAPVRLTSLAKLCKEAQRSYRSDLARARAKGLSVALSRSELLQLLRDIRDRRNALCRRDAREEPSLPTPGSSSSEISRITITSSSFSHEGVIPLEYFNVDADGFNISPQLSWSVDRPGIGQFALAMFDSHAAGEQYMHWCVTGLNSSTRSIAEGASGTTSMPGGYIEWRGGALAGYEGPEAATGSFHPYTIELYGLSNASEINPLTGGPTGICTFNSLSAAMAGSIVAKGSYSGYVQNAPPAIPVP